MAYPSVVARTKDWGTEILTDADLEGQFDLINTWINAAMNASTGHKHDGTTSEGPKILTANINDSAGTAGDVFYSDGTSLTRLAVGTDGQLLTVNTGATAPEWTTVAADQTTDGSVLQIVNATDGAVATGTTVVPPDDTIPQNTEGDEYMTLAITPAATTNVLVIEAVVNCNVNSGGAVATGLFQDSTAGALAAVYNDISANGRTTQMVLRHYMVAGTTSATTFKIRAGVTTSGTFTFNGVSSARYFGGVMASSITITEIKAS